MIDFTKLPIYLHQRSQLNWDQLGLFNDGLHFYINIDCNAGQYIQLYNTILNTLDRNINQECRGGAGLSATLDIYFDNVKGLQLSGSERDKLVEYGYNPIVFIPGRGLVIWGSRLVYNGDNYRYHSMFNTQSLGNLNIFAHQYKAYISDDAYMLSKEKEDLILMRSDIDYKLGRIEQELSNIKENNCGMLESNLCAD
jgi:hypothetical protein